MPAKKQPRAQRLLRIERRLTRLGSKIIDPEAIKEFIHLVGQQRDELHATLDKVFERIGDNQRELDRRLRVLEKINGIPGPGGGGGQLPIPKWKH